MRIWILTQYYPPEFGAVAVRLSRLARLLAADGHEITVLTSLPNYPEGIISPAYRGHIFLSEVTDNVQIRRVWVYATPRKTASARLLNQISFMLVAALHGTFLLRPDVIYVESHPLFICLTGGWLGWIKRAPVVLNVSDLWPESAIATGALRADSLLVKVARRVEYWSYRMAAHVVGMTAGVQQGVINILHCPEKVSLIQNAVDLDQFRPDVYGQAIRQRYHLDGRFVVSHIGNMSLAHDFDLILDVAAALPEMVFVFAGGGSQMEYIKDRIAKQCLNNVILTGILPHSDMPTLWAATDVCLISLKDHPLFSGALPSKMFEALATGTPVVAAIRGEGTALLEQNQAGIVVPIGDASAMIAALKKLEESSELRAQLAANGRIYAERYLSPERVKQAYLDLFSRVSHQ